MSRLNNLSRVALVIVAAACATLWGTARARAGDANPFQIITGFSAKEACSCAFVVEQTDDYCKAYGQAAGLPPLTIALDHSAKTVTSSLAGTSRTARFTDGAGCLTDPLDPTP